jgi:exopolysaccharide production protein ExoZ
MKQLIQTATHSGAARSQLVSIQYLRGLAALSVLVTHALQWPLADINMALLKTGRLGVEVFFVISGFIITTIAGEGRFDPRGFLVRRAYRIVPAYWTATLLTAALAIAMPNQFRTTIPTIEGLIKSLLFIPSLEPKAPLLLLGWTLNFEAFFYLVFASLFFLKSGMRTFVLLCLFGVLVAIGQFSTGLSYVEAIYTSPSLIGFCFGTLLAQAYRHGVIGYLSRTLHIPVLAAPAALLAAFYLIGWDSAEQIALWKHLLMSITALSIVLFGLSYETKSQVALVWPLKYLGDASYSVYLFHIFSVGAVWSVAKRLFDVHQPLAYLSCTAVAIVVGLAFSFLCHHFVERPFFAAGPKRNQAVPVT